MAKAKRKFRIDSLSPEDRRVLQQITQYDSAALDEIEQTGKLPDRIASKFGPSEISSLNTLLAKLPSAKDAYQKFIDQGGDKEADLADDELQERLEAFKGLGGAHPEVVKGYDNQVANMSAQIDGAFKSQGVSVPIKTLKEISEYAINSLRAGNYNPQQVANIIGRDVWGSGVTAGAYGGAEDSNPIRVAKSVGEDIPKVYDTQVKSKEFEDKHGPSGPTFDEDIKRIQDILDDRGVVARKEGEFQNFLAQAPAESRQLRISGLAQRGKETERFLADRFGPRTVAELNRYGLAEGPDVASVIAAKAGELQGVNEDIFRAEESADNAFFAEAAYRLNTAKLEMSESTFRTSVEGERGLIRQGQGQRAESGQKEIQRQFELALLDREARRNINLRNQDIQIGEDQSKDALVSGLTSDVANNTAQIVAGKIVYGAKGSDGKTQPSPSFKRLG